MLAIENIRACGCEELRKKIRSNAFNLVVVGQFKRGKTSLINALLGEEILPVAVVPLTSIRPCIRPDNSAFAHPSYSPVQRRHTRPARRYPVDLPG
jgi:septin family protein